MMAPILDDEIPEQRHGEANGADKTLVQRRDSCKGGLRDFRCKMMCVRVPLLSSFYHTRYSKKPTGMWPRRTSVPLSDEGSPKRNN